MTQFHLPRSARRVLAAVLCAVTTLTTHAALDAPVSPNALPAVAAELQFFKNIQGRYLVAGQQEFPGWPDELSSNPAAKDIDFNYIREKTGRTPGIRGFDFLFYTHSASGRAVQHSTERAIKWAQDGGLVTFCCHMFMDSHSPAGNPQFYVPSANNGTGTTIDIRQAVVDGTPENTEMLAKFDLIAAELKKLRDAGVVVIWRPFHECSGGWFWWGANGPTAFKQAWRIMFTRFTQLHGLTNLIWCYNPTDSFSKLQDWYPGDDVVDMISLDIYPGAGTHPTYSADYVRMRDFTAGRKVVALSENGAIPDIDQLFAEGAGWGYFCTWNGFESNTAQNSVSFLSTVFNHAKVVTRDELPSLYYLYSPPVALDAPVQAVTDGANATLTATATNGTAFQWQVNGSALPGATSAAFTLTNVQPANAGLYTASVTSPSATSRATIVGIDTAKKVAGAAHEVGSDIFVAANGKTFDQVLLEGAAASIKADFSPEPSANQITRISYIDLDDDIVQVEYSGPGTLSLVLDTPTGPSAPEKYNQTTNYMKGHAGIVITGATEYSNLSVFSVGRTTAVNQALFKDNVTYDGIADLAFIAIASSNGKFGGVRTADTNFFAAKGLTGLYAPGVAFIGPVYLGNISAFENATPVILLGSSTTDNRITGGDLAQPNHRAVQVTGVTTLTFTAGTDSHGTVLAARANQAVLQQNGLDVTTQIVVNPIP